MRERDRLKSEYSQIINNEPYVRCHYKKFNYNLLKYILKYNTRGSGEITSYNDIIIMVDTETSKKKPDEPYYEKGELKYNTYHNHVVVWTISLRAYGHNIATIYGRKPSKLAETILRIHEMMAGYHTVFYIHNLSYDHIFIRKFIYNILGYPIRQLNVKNLYPIYIEYANGIIFKDSLILAQRNLEKWAKDMNVEHQKLTGSWDYDKMRDQDTPLSEDELSYAEYDTLAGVECLDKTLEGLNKKIYTIPLTATGIPREQTRRAGKKKAHDDFLKLALDYNQYIKFCCLYHGGYTHGNRHFINILINWCKVRCFDFASSYPFAMLAFKFPMEKFTEYKNCSIDEIVSNMDTYAYAFKFIATNIRLKTDDTPMPALQYSKLQKSINVIQDNGRVLCANYVEIYLTEYDAAVIAEQYTWDHHLCVEVEYAYKDYLPKWFTDYIYECFRNKTMLKGGDPVLYAIAKALINALYGMCVQHSIQEDIIEDYESGDFYIEHMEDPEVEYEKYLNKIRTILPYQWGVWVTAIAFYNLHQLVKCCRLPFYCDTDSCYGADWDMDKVNAYNEGCKQKLVANGYGPIIKDGREYWLGIAETDGDNDLYTEFKYMGAKRYCGRCEADGELHITVAGVPKKKGATCLNNDINNFHPGFIFSGTTTGKKTHVYFNSDIYIDDHGNETADSISLIPCDYTLNTITVYDWESLFKEEVEIQVYDEY